MELSTASIPRLDGHADGKADTLHATFIRNVEHELRTPLTIMQGYTELLQNGALGELAPEQQQALFIIANRAGEMTRLVEHIGVLMSVESCTGVALPVALDELLAEVVQKRRAWADKQGVALSARTDGNLVATGDPRQLREAVDCLVDNAIKFTSGGGRVEVRGFAEPGWVCVTVRDTGLGIAPDQLPYLGTGFYQVDSSSTRRYGGLGLGLTVVRSVVEAHTGQLDVTSTPGQGSAFTIRLPASAHTRGEAPRAEHPPRVLIVDDEASLAVTLQAGLAKLFRGEIMVETNSDNALRLCEQQPFDLVITDYVMPGMDGMTLAARIRQRHPHTAILLLTAYGDSDVRAQAAQLEIQRVLDKPIRLQEIRTAALEALHEKR